MPYDDFTLERVHEAFGIATSESRLFPTLPRIPAPDWLTKSLERRTQLALLSEKSRSEFIVVPILLASRELSPITLAIFSGQRLDIDAARGLSGECDFILAAAPPVPPLRAPSPRSSRRRRTTSRTDSASAWRRWWGLACSIRPADAAMCPIYGCVTTGEVWQFLKLVDSLALIDDRRYYLDDIEGILGAIQAIIAEGNHPR